MSAEQRPSVQAVVEVALRKHMLQPTGSTWYGVTAKSVLDALAEAGYSFWRQATEAGEPWPCSYIRSLPTQNDQEQGR